MSQIPGTKSGNKGADHQGRHLSFSLGEEEYGIPLLSVKEVIAVPEVTRIPRTPSYFLGIMNLRGQIITVIDLRAKLGITARPNSECAVIICDLQPNPVGILVDSVNSVLRPEPGEVSARPGIESGEDTDYIQGVYRGEERLVLFIDINKVLSPGDHQHLAQANSAAA